MTRTRTLLLAAGCTAAGALGAGGLVAVANDGDRDRGHHGFSGLHGAIHAEAVVPRGDSFTKVTFDRGTVVDVEDDVLTVREGTDDEVYDVVKLTIPGDARIHIADWGYRRHTFDGDDDHDEDQLSDLKAGDRVAVWQSARRTLVLAKSG